jgi:hypothetical protein
MNNPPDGNGRAGKLPSQRLCADDVARLKPFGALEQIELDSLTLVDRAVAVLLNRDHNRSVHGITS